MKKALYFLILALIFATCQTKTKVIPVDLNAAKVSVTAALDKFNAEFKGKDANTLMTLLTDDGLYCGTDSKELLNKVDLSKMVTQSFADSTLKLDYTVDKREIRIAKDGNSAVALEQFFMQSFSQKIPVRMIYHLVKNNDNWLFDFVSWNFIPNNEDITKLNKALE